MKRTVKIYGASDDLVEVEGDVPGCNEYAAFDAPRYVEFSTGDVFKVWYDDEGCWRVVHERAAGVGGATCSIVLATGAEDIYTDTATVTGEFEWVEVWESYPPEVAEMRVKLGRAIADGDDDIDHDRILTDDEVGRIWAIVAAAQRRAVG